MSPSDANESSSAATAAVDWAHLLGRLKTVPRTGWVRRGITGYESVADHSWRVSALALLLDNVNVEHCLALGVVHDLAESLVGDIAPDDQIAKEDKRRMEHEAMETIASGLRQARGAPAADRLLCLFDEYERRESKEAQAVKDLDRLDMILQADEYERIYDQDLSDFFHSTPPECFQHGFLRDVAQEVHWQRAERVAKKMPPRDHDGLSPSDEAFLQEFSQASSLNRNDIAQVITGLRAWDNTAES